MSLMCRDEGNTKNGESIFSAESALLSIDLPLLIFLIPVLTTALFSFKSIWGNCLG